MSRQGGVQPVLPHLFSQLRKPCRFTPYQILLEGTQKIACYAADGSQPPLADTNEFFFLRTSQSEVKFSAED
jgi:hypothetical protein